jgi:hypothetical protein
MDTVPVTVVPNELEAEQVCAALRDEGIEAFYKRTNMSAATTLGSASGFAPFEIWVSEADADRAQALLGEGEEDGEG